MTYKNVGEGERVSDNGDPYENRSGVCPPICAGKSADYVCTRTNLNSLCCCKHCYIMLAHRVRKSLRSYRWKEEKEKEETRRLISFGLAPDLFPSRPATSQWGFQSRYSRKNSISRCTKEAYRACMQEGCQNCTRHTFDSAYTPKAKRIQNKLTSLIFIF